MPNNKYEYKLGNIPVTDTQKKILDKYLHYGMRKRVFMKIVALLCKELETNPEIFIVTVLKGELNLKEKIEELDDGNIG